MNTNILVTYASSYGATKQIAEKIGEVLRQEGFQADVCPVDTKQDLTPYQAVVLGSAVYIGSWLKVAAAFLKANEKSLSDRPVWLFSSGPTGEGDPAELLDGWQLPVDLQPVADRIHPRDTAVFHGYINPAKLNFVQRWVMKNMVKKPMGDYRDWDAITSWAAGIAGTLKNAE